MHFLDNPKDNKRLRDIVGTNPLVKSMKEKDNESERQESFEAVHVLVMAADDLYCSGKMNFDTTLDNLSKAILKLKGKEKELAKSEEDKGEVAE